MNLVKEFENFWRQEQYSIDISNKQSFYEEFLTKLMGVKNTVELDTLIMQQGGRKEKTRQIVVRFYDWLKKQGHEIESDLYDKNFYNSALERQLEIVKYLHNDWRKIEDIADHFGVSGRKIREDLNALEDGIEVLGSTIKVTREKKGTAYCYKTTMHPIFLPLNLTEVYAMTTYLENTLHDNSPNGQIVRNVSARIKTQLSEYAKNKIMAEDDTLYGNNDYMDDEELAMQRESIKMYLMKSGQKCRFIWEDTEYEGFIRYSGGEYIMVTSSGQELDADIDDVDIIIDSVEYI